LKKKNSRGKAQKKTAPPPSTLRDLPRRLGPLQRASAKKRPYLKHREIAPSDAVRRNRASNPRPTSFAAFSHRRPSKQLAQVLIRLIVETSHSRDPEILPNASGDHPGNDPTFRDEIEDLAA